MGREISQVMGHLGAGWLERQSRTSEERTDILIESLPINENSVIADIGAGTGYFSLPMAELAKLGIVYAVDIQPEMLEMITARAKISKLENIIPIRASRISSNLPSASIDMALFVDAYHEFDFPREFIQDLYMSMKPGGKLILIEYRAEDPAIAIKKLHKMTEKQSIMEIEAAGFEWQKTLDILPQQHFMIFHRSE
jgi:ubiquinone/menaquinone biosynthesis C-methylase UbiE